MLLDAQASRDQAADKLVDLRLLLCAMSTLGKEGKSTVEDLVNDLQATINRSADAPAQSEREEILANRRRLAATLGALGA